MLHFMMWVGIFFKKKRKKKEEEEERKSPGCIILYIWIFFVQQGEKMGEGVWFVQ